MRARPLLLALALAVLAGGATYRALQDRTAPAPVLPSAVMVARALPVGARVAEHDLRVVQMPGESIPDGAVRTVADAAGRYVVLPALAGELLMGAKLGDAPPGSTLATVIPAGARAVSVNVNTAGLVSPGDHVDVLGIMSREPEALAEVVLRDVVVLAVSDTILGTPAAEAAATEQKGGSEQRAVTVTLAVSEEQARRLVQVDDVGRLRLAMRPREDSPSSAWAPE